MNLEFLSTEIHPQVLHESPVEVAEPRSFITTYINKRQSKLEKKRRKLLQYKAQVEREEVVIHQSSNQRLIDRLILSSSKMRLDVDRLLKESRLQPSRQAAGNSERSTGGKNRESTSSSVFKAPRHGLPAAASHQSHRRHPLLG